MTNEQAPCPPLPHQPLYKGSDGVVRFKGNAVVACVLEHHPLSLTDVMAQDYGQDAKVQFIQLLGSSLAQLQALGFGEVIESPVGLRRKSPSNVRHPLQPLELDADGVVRFKRNAIVRMLLDTGPKDLNDLAVMGHPKEDWEQLAQLIGYSHSGTTNLSYLSDRVYHDSWAEWETREALFRQRQLENSLPDASTALGRGPRL